MSANAARRESSLWAKQRPLAEAAVEFWNDFLGLSRVEGAHEPLTRQERDHLLTIVRVVSWVRTEHGTGTTPRASVDPMQSGSPHDMWWPQLVSPPSPEQERVIAGPGRRNYWAGELPEATVAAHGFPAAAALMRLTRPNDGHDSPRFTPAMSYVWGTLALIHAINESAGAPTYVCSDLSAQRLLSGAVAYDRQRTPDAQTRYDEAWGALGVVVVPAPLSMRRVAVARASADVRAPVASVLNVTNTKLADVPTAIATLPGNGRDIKFAGKIKEKGGDFTHLQGLTAYKDVYFLTQSDEFETVGRLLVADRVTQTLLHEFRLPLVSTNPKYFHAGGCQVIGDILVIPSEAQDNKSVVCFFDVSDPANVIEIPELRVFNDIRDAAAVGITNVTRDGREVWVLAVFDSGTVDVYESSDLAGRAPFTKLFFDKVTEKHHQAMPLITDTSNRVFALGINRTFFGEDIVAVYALDFAAGTVLPFPDASKSDFKFKTHKGGSLRWGTDLEIVSASAVVMHCTSKHYTNGCHINVFDPAAPPQRARRKASVSRRLKRASGRPNLGAQRAPRRAARKEARPRLL